MRGAAENKQTGNNGARGKPGPGRPKGSQNKVTAAVKDMILQALHNKGGVEYLEQQADENPTAFLTLVGKVLPLQLTGNNGGPVEFTHIKLIGVTPDHAE